MARFTQAQRDSLVAAIAEGALEVQYENKRVKYHSLDEMLRLLSIMDQDLGLAPTGGAIVIEAHFDKGL